MLRFIPSKRIKNREYSVAGWNDIVADKHEAARIAETIKKYWKVVH